jgi:hypothetical protein
MGGPPMFAVLRNLAGTPDKEQERSESSLPDRVEDRCAFA